jgi:acyl-CoA hydrolase
MKRISESRSVLSEIMLPCQANPNGKVHGGEIVKIMDTCAGVAAMRHAKKNAVTVRIDQLEFYDPIMVGELVICEAQLVFAGKTSMEVEVIVKVEDLMTEAPARVALKAFFTFVALDEEGKPTPVPGLLLKSDEEKAAFAEGERRYLAHKKRK